MKSDTDIRCSRHTALLPYICEPRFCPLYTSCSGDLTFQSTNLPNGHSISQFRRNCYFFRLKQPVFSIILIGLYYQKKRGFIVIKGISKHECRLIYLYVDEYYRQKGIGKHLLSEAKNTAKQLGYTKISLYVLSNNEIAQSLYKNSNFETTKLRMECSLNE